MPVSVQRQSFQVQLCQQLSSAHSNWHTRCSPYHRLEPIATTFLTRRTTNYQVLPQGEEGCLLSSQVLLGEIPSRFQFLSILLHVHSIVQVAWQDEIRSTYHWSSHLNVYSLSIKIKTPVKSLQGNWDVWYTLKPNYAGVGRGWGIIKRSSSADPINVDL